MKQAALQKLLAQASLAGIYHLPHSGQITLEKAATTLGFACFRVDLEESSDLKANLEVLGHGLRFPDWYGTNLDALNDCLTDFSWLEARGYVIVLSGADALHSDLAGFVALNEVFASAIAQWQTRGVPLWIFYDLRANGLSALPTLA